MDNADGLDRASCGRRRLGGSEPRGAPKNEAMTTAPEHTTVTSLTDLVEVVPSLLGFHPAESIVLLGVEDGTIAVTARTDISDAPSRALAPAWRRLPGALVILIAYTLDPGLAWAGLDEVGSALPEGTERILVHADGELWFEHPLDDGTPYDARSSVHLARAAFSGRPVRASRDELYRLVEPIRSPAEVTASIERVAARVGVLSDVVAEALALVEAHDEVPGELEIDEATILCLASHDSGFLDGALASTTVDNAETRLSLWLQVVGSSVPNCAGAALVAAGLAAWLSGNGALQSVCLEASIDRPAPPGWVGFLDAVNREALPPTEWASLRASSSAPRVSTMPT